MRGLCALLALALTSCAAPEERRPNIAEGLRLVVGDPSPDWSARLREYFHPGLAPVTGVVSVLRSNGFEVDVGASRAEYRWKTRSCRKTLTAEWTMNMESAVSEIQGAYSNVCG